MVTVEHRETGKEYELIAYITPGVAWDCEGCFFYSPNGDCLEVEFDADKEITCGTQDIIYREKE